MGGCRGKGKKRGEGDPHHHACITMQSLSPQASLAAARCAHVCGGACNCAVRVGWAAVYICVVMRVAAGQQKKKNSRRKEKKNERQEEERTMISP